MDKDINEFLAQCDICQKTKKFKHETKNTQRMDVELIAIADKCAETVAEALFSR